MCTAIIVLILNETTSTSEWEQRSSHADLAKPDLSAMKMVHRPINNELIVSAVQRELAAMNTIGHTAEDYTTVRSIDFIFCRTQHTVQFR